MTAEEGRQVGYIFSTLVHFVTKFLYGQCGGIFG